MARPVGRLLGALVGRPVGRLVGRTHRPPSIARSQGWAQALDLIHEWSWAVGTYPYVGLRQKPVFMTFQSTKGIHH